MKRNLSISVLLVFAAFLAVDKFVLNQLRQRRLETLRSTQKHPSRLKASRQINQQGVLSIALDVTGRGGRFLIWARTVSTPMRTAPMTAGFTLDPFKMEGAPLIAWIVIQIMAI
jgi:hypothetical protein